MAISASKRSWKDAFRMSSKTTEVDVQPQRPAKPQATKTEPRTLEETWGRPLKMLSNEGAGGSILLLTRPRDNATFAVKRFRRRHFAEDESSYARKIVSEYYVGAKLHHSNVIKTLDLFEEDGQFWQVMEYAPYCLFDRVMSRSMSVEEINCAFMQMLAGVSHLHRAGFAHRDLKLENVVITENGILKLIDFGSAMVCKDPGLRSATGFVGCTPYMAPEIFLHRPYDAQKADVWSLAIVYCCMVLGRFPWKAPDRSNESFMRFAATDSNANSISTPTPPSRASSTNSVTIINVSIVDDCSDKPKISETIFGTWSLLRQLPCESRDVIKAMLCLNPNSRPTLEQVLKMPWVVLAQSCSEDAVGTVHAVAGHKHAS